MAHFMSQCIVPADTLTHRMLQCIGIDDTMAHLMSQSIVPAINFDTHRHMGHKPSDPKSYL